MENEKIEIERIVEYWVATSDKDYDAMCNLYKTKDYHWALFIGHIVIEKLLKASIAKRTKKHAPFTMTLGDWQDYRI